jgi:hypothetical protein
MHFVPSNRDDIIRYYRNTYIKLSEYGDMLFLVENIDSMRVMGRCENGDPFCIYMDEDTPYKVEYILPHKTFFQLGANAVQLQRVPAKQYFRGLCSQNTQMLMMIAPGQLRQAELNFANLKQFVTKQAFSGLRAAIGNNEAVSVVLSPRMMYLRSRKEIYIDFTPVAKVNPGKLLVSVTKPIFLNEVKELLENHGESKYFTVDIHIPPPPKEKTKTADLLKEMGAANKVPVVKKATFVPPEYAPPLPVANWAEVLMDDGLQEGEQQ